MRAISSRRAEAASSSTSVKASAVLAAARLALAHAPVMGAARGDLGRVGDDKDLELPAQALQPFADRRRGRPADARIHLVEHQRRRRGDAREHHLERQHEAGELAARGDLGDGTHGAARIGRDLEANALHTLLPPLLLCERREPRGKARPLEFERRQLRHDRAVETGRGLGPRRGERARSPDIGLARRGDGLLVLLLGLAALVDRREARREGIAQRGEPVARHLVLAGEVAQGIEPLLDRIEPARLGIEGAAEGRQRGQHLAELEGGTVEGRECWIEPARRFLRRALELTPRASERPLEPVSASLRLAAQECQGRVERLDHLLAMHEEEPLLGEGCLLAGLGGQALELGKRVSQEFFVPPCRLALGREGGMGRKRCAPGTVRCPHAIKEGRVAAEGVKCRAMGCRIDEPVLIELTLDLDEAVAELAEEADADRLVVDEGAAAPVRRQHPAQEERLLARELLACEHRPCRMVARELEGRGDAGLAGTLAHEGRIGAGAECQAESIEQDRLAGTRLAGQHG